MDAEIIVHPFELNPDVGPEGEAIVDYVGKKYGRTPEQVAEAQVTFFRRLVFALRLLTGLPRECRVGQL